MSEATEVKEKAQAKLTKEWAVSGYVCTSTTQLSGMLGPIKYELRRSRYRDDEGLYTFYYRNLASGQGAVHSFFSKHDREGYQELAGYVSAVIAREFAYA
jgi:hypothetical protein